MLCISVVIGGQYFSTVECLTAIGLLLAGGWGFYQALTQRSESLAQRPLHLVLPVGLSCCLLSLAVGASQGSFNWTPDMRFSTTLALAHGYDPYPPVGSGAVQVAMYPPAYTLLLLPAAGAAAPNQAFIMAGLTVAGLFAACSALALRAARWRSTGITRFDLLALWLLLSLVLASGPVRFAATAISPDGPALSLGLLAIALAWQSAQSESGAIKAWLPPALLAWLAVWTKQTMVPIIPLIPLLAWSFRGWRVMWQSALAVTIAGIVVSLPLMALFSPPQNLLAQIYAVPGSIPFRLEMIGGWSGAILELAKSCALPLAALAILVVVLGKTQGWKPTMQGAWGAMMVAAVALMPTSLLGFVKIGGNFNTFTPTVGFLLMAVVLAARDAASMASDSNAPSQCRKVAHAPLIVLSLTLLAGVMTAVQLPEAQRNLHALRSLENSAANRTYRYAQANPGVAYFPYHVVPQLMAEGRMYPHENGLQVLQDARRPIDRDALLASLPAKLKYLAFHPTDLRVEDSYVRELLPEFDEKIDLAELPGWVVYQRSSKSHER